MNIPWDDLELFLAVAEEHSFSAAARRLGLTQPTISRRMSALEERLKHALFRRDVEGAHLTEEGAKLYPAAVEMARYAGELNQIATNFEETPAGIVRIAAPPGTAFDFLVPFAKALRSSLPEIQLQAIAGIEHLDLSRGHAELALRNRAPTQPDLMVLAHAKVEVGIFASEAYALALNRSLCEAKRRLTLKDIDWISWAYPNEHLEPTPLLSKHIEAFAPAFASNDFNVQTRAMAEGLGAMIYPKMRHAFEAFGPFVELEVQLPLPAVDMYLVCAKTMRHMPRVRAVASELVKALSDIEGLSMQKVDADTAS